MPIVVVRKCRNISQAHTHTCTHMRLCDALGAMLFREHIQEHTLTQKRQPHTTERITTRIVYARSMRACMRTHLCVRVRVRKMLPTAAAAAASKCHPKTQTRCRSHSRVFALNRQAKWQYCEIYAHGAAARTRE